MTKYRNKTDIDLFIPGYGLVKAGGVILLGDDFNNANFIKIVKEKKEDVENLKEINNIIEK